MFVFSLPLTTLLLNFQLTHAWSDNGCRKLLIHLVYFVFGQIFRERIRIRMFFNDSVIRRYEYIYFRLHKPHAVRDYTIRTSYVLFRYYVYGGEI
jgi:hypothetical protein